MTKFLGKSERDATHAEKKMTAREQKAQLKKEKEEEAARAAEVQLQAERERLLSMTEKELLVELILTMRGYDERIQRIEKSAKSAELDSSISALNSSTANLNSLLK